MHQEIIAAVKRLRPWCHCTDLGEGVKTKTESIAGEPVDHPWGTWQTIHQCLPENLSGKSVPRIACNAGFYAVEAKWRGAGCFSRSGWRAGPCVTFGEDGKCWARYIAVDRPERPD
jgi:hypothetical protein